MSPCLGQRGQKPVPCPPARPRIAQIREYQPPLPYSTGIFEKKRKLQICHLVLLVVVVVVVVAGEGGSVFLFNRLPDLPSSERGRRETEHFQRATSLVYYRKVLPRIIA